MDLFIYSVFHYDRGLYLRLILFTLIHLLIMFKQVTINSRQKLQLSAISHLLTNLDIELEKSTPHNLNFTHIYIAYK